MTERIDGAADDAGVDDAQAAPRPRAGEVDLSPLEELLAYHLRRAQVLAFQSFAEALGGDNMSPGQLGVLLLVRQNPGINQTRLGAALGIDRSTLVAVLDRLQARKLVARKPSPTDRRSHALELTAAGQAFLDDLLPRVAAHEAEIAQPLTERERRTLIALLRKVSGV